MKKITDINTLFTSSDAFLYNGDCLDLLISLPDSSVDLIISSPPYCMKKAYENISDDINTFREQQEKIIPELYRILKLGGSLCWQTGYHVADSCSIPLDYFVYEIFSGYAQTQAIPLILRNRIIWTFGHGLNATLRFSGRHETILWFTKGSAYNFDLDAVRVPQKYPGKTYYKGEKKGQFSGNPMGKNPSDVWEIPNVKANHVEKTSHPCQFPIAIPQRLIRALTKVNDIILDPFMGAGTAGAAAIMENRRFLGAETVAEYFEISTERVKQAKYGNLKYRKDVPVMEPDPKMSVAVLPDEFKRMREKK